jgi:hypothetical protein
VSEQPRSLGSSSRTFVRFGAADEDDRNFAKRKSSSRPSFAAPRSRRKARLGIVGAFEESFLLRKLRVGHDGCHNPARVSASGTPRRDSATHARTTMAEDDDKKWWKDKEKLQPGAIGAAIGVAVCAAGIWIKNKKDEKDE